MQNDPQMRIWQKESTGRHTEGVYDPRHLLLGNLG